VPDTSIRQFQTRFLGSLAQHRDRQGKPACPWFIPAIIIAASAFLALIPADVRAASGNKPAAGALVSLSDIAPSIRQDIRYATANNFMGRPLPGYNAPKCLLQRPAAGALARVQADLAKHDPPLGLKVFDCYRPMRAVRAMADWVSTAEGKPPAFHHPGTAKSRLIALGYISTRSAHASGTAIDLTLVIRTTPSARPVQSHKTPLAPVSGPSTNGPSPPVPDSRKTGTCRDTGTDPTDPRAIDMGTLFDCFDPKSRTYASGLTMQQNRWRKTLVDAMERQGFKNYSREWWHFTYRNARRGPSLDQPIE